MSIAQQAQAWAESQEHAEVLVMLGGRLLLDWLLTAAAKLDTTPEQVNAERALLNLLQNRESRLHKHTQPDPECPNVWQECYQYMAQTLSFCSWRVAREDSVCGAVFTGGAAKDAGHCWEEPGQR